MAEVSPSSLVRWARALELVGAPLLFHGVPGEAMDREGGYTLTPTNGAALSASTVLGLPAWSLDGSNDYIATSFGTRRNLCTNPSIETNTTGWAGDGGTISRDLTEFYSGIGGVASLKVTGTGGGPGRGTAMSPAITVASSTTYTFSCWVKGIASAALRLYVNESVGGAQTWTTNFTATGSWQRVSVTFTTGASATAVIPRVITQANLDTTFYVDGVLVEQAGSLGTYFDGSGYVNGSGAWVATDEVWRTDLSQAWTGTAHASTSTLGGRTNYALDPRCELATATHWRNDSTMVLPAKTSAWPVGRQGQGGKWTLAALATSTLFGSTQYTTSGGKLRWSAPNAGACTISCRVWNDTNQILRATVYWRSDAAGTAVGSPTTVNIPVGYDGPLVVFSGTTPAGAIGCDLSFSNYSGSAATGTFYATEFVNEYTTAALPYFDGSGAIERQGLTGWLGTPHASASDCGLFANGTTRTVAAVVQADSFATARTLLGATPYGADYFMYLTAASPPTLYMSAAGGGVELSAATRLATGRSSLLAVQMNEPGNAHGAWQDGASIGTGTGTDQWTAGGILLIGSSNGGTPFDGLIGPVAIFSGALNAAEHQSLIAALRPRRGEVGGARVLSGDGATTLVEVS